MPVGRIDRADLPATPHLLLVNHCSYLDALVLCAALPPAAGYCFAAKRELLRQPMMHAFLRALGTLFVERFDVARSVEDVEDIVIALRRGQRVILFPEGTFSREAGLKPKPASSRCAWAPSLPLPVPACRSSPVVCAERARYCAMAHGCHDLAG